MNQQYDTIVIGAGIAGLAVALRLRRKGAHVLVLEKNAKVGGKMNEYESQGFRWDSGPSLFTLPHLVDELYALYQKNPENYYTYSKEEEACRYFFEDATEITFYTNWERLRDEVQTKLKLNPRALELYLERSAKKYETVGSMFLEHSIHKLNQLPFGQLVRQAPQFAGANLWTSLHKHNKRNLKHPKLVQIFDRYATYNGSNPYKASGVLSMIPHLEQNIGTFFPKKGMRSIVEGLYELAKEAGVEFEMETSVTSCTTTATGYKVEAAQTYESKRVICAIDCVTFYKNIFKNQALLKRYQKQERSSSALIFYWGVQKQFPKLGLHNIFFSEDYRQEFAQIFDQKKVPIDGTIYVHISAKVNAADAPEGGENWFVMLNTPAGATIDDALQQKIKTALLKRLERRLGTSIADHIVTERVWTPKGIDADTGSYMGALYGASSNSKLAALTRHPNFLKQYKGLYFCGGTVHPGGGIPLALQSAKIVEKLIANEG